MNATMTVHHTQRLRARAAAYALLARSLDREVEALCDRRTRSTLETALRRAQEADALLVLGPGVVLDPTDPLDRVELEQLRGRWIRWFDLGRVPPYEGSNSTMTSGGVTPRLADIAGFYRAFGLAVVADRPDHVIAQLEFLAYALTAEAEAIEDGDDDHADRAAAAVRTFVRDHVGGWLDVWSARVHQIRELSPWFGVIAAATALVASEARLRNVVPITSAGPIDADAGVPADDEPLLDCGDETDTP